MAHSQANVRARPDGRLAQGSRDGPPVRSSGEELDVLWASGHPFYRPGWGTNVVGMVIDGGVDWAEVAELVTDSYRIMAPKKLAASVEGPPPAVL